jgi:Glyoxalase-like domain
MWLRLRQIALAAAELSPAVDALTSVLGIEVCFNDPAVRTFGLENALMPVGNQFIEVVAPIEEGTAAGRYLDRRGGDGGYMVITQCDDHDPRRARIEALGVRQAFSFETPGEFRNVQLHPKDTGGSFFEIDEQQGPGAHDADGPWEPAGRDWKRHQRLDTVDGIVAAELQADDPDALAGRWGEIAEIPVTRDRHGHPILGLQNAELRFVPCIDGRPEGLGGLDLHAVDGARVLAAADARGVPRTGDTIELVGMRIRLV